MTGRNPKLGRNQSRNSHATLENTFFERKNTPENKPSWNAAAKTDSINKIYNPEIKNPNEVSL